MFKTLGKLFGGGSGEKSSLDQRLGNLSSMFLYQYSFVELPEKFFNNTGQFLRESGDSTLLGKCSSHQLNDDLAAIIVEYRQFTDTPPTGKALFAVAIYNTSTNEPHEFYVMIENPMGIRFRQVGSDMASWVLRDGMDEVDCNPDVHSIASLFSSRVGR